MSSNPSRYYTSAEYQFCMADPMPITFVADTEGSSGGRQLALNTMTYVDFRSERASQSAPTNFQPMHSPTVFYNLHPNIHQMCHCGRLLEVCQSPTADHVPYPNSNWDQRYEQAALYPGLDDQTTRRVPVIEFQSISLHSVPMPRSDSISSVSSFSSAQSSPLLPTQDWQTIARPHSLPSYAAPSDYPRGQSIEFRRPVQEPQHTNVSPLPDRRSRKVTGRRDRREKSKGRAYCQLCDKDFARPADVNRHVRTGHEKTKFTCNWCDRVFNRSDILLRHVNQNCAVRKEKQINKPRTTIFTLKGQHFVEDSTNHE